MNIIEFLKTLPHVEPDADYLNAADYYPYLNALARDYKAERILEVGVRFGYSAVAFIHANSVREYVGVDYDLYDATSSTKSRDNLNYVSQQQALDVTLIKKNTQTLDDLTFLDGRRFDFIHIDGDHSYEGALTDLKNFWNVLTVGGHMLVDDSIFYGSVRSACLAFADLTGEPHYDVKTYRGTWVFLKTRERTFPVSQSVVNERTPAPPIDHGAIAHRFFARHPGWSGPVNLYSDGTFTGGLNSPDGRWLLDDDTLTLGWYHWPPTVLIGNAEHSHFSSVGASGLTLYAIADDGHVAAHLGGNIHGGDPATFYPDLWKWLVERYRVSSVLDIGCGEGHAMAEFQTLGARTFGVDGYAPNLIEVERRGLSGVLHDFTAGPPPIFDEFDLGWCCEFVEHVDERFVDHILAAFSRCRVIALTHALPGQGGHHHVNCQPPDYWIAKLRAAGFVYLETETRAARLLHPSSYWGRTGLLFQRVS